MNFVPIILVRPVCLHLNFSTFLRLSAALVSNFFRFYLIISIFPCENHFSQEILALFVSRVSFNLHAIHLLIASSNFTEIDLIH